MKILVTGGAGFIASHIVDAYLEAGHQVVIIDNLYSGSKENINPKAKFYLMDVRCPEVEKVFQEEKFEVVNHQAAQMDVRKSVEDPIFDAQVNVLGSINILENCIKNGVSKFVFASTGGAVYGEQDYFPADEEHPLRPLSPYGVTKLVVEKYLHFYHETYGLKYVILRYSNVYGPRQNPHGEAGVVAIFSEKFLAGDQPIINGDGEQTRDFVFVGDVVRANLLALNHNRCDYFNIGTGLEITVNEIFRNLKAITGANVKEYHGAAKEGEQRRSVIAYSKAEKILGWKPQVNLQEGLRRTVEYFRRRM